MGSPCIIYVAKYSLSLLIFQLSQVSLFDM